MRSEIDAHDFRLRFAMHLLDQHDCRPAVVGSLVFGPGQTGGSSMIHLLRTRPKRDLNWSFTSIRLAGRCLITSLGLGDWEFGAEQGPWLREGKHDATDCLSQDMCMNAACQNHSEKRSEQPQAGRALLADVAC